MKILLGDCIEKMRELPDNSVDSVVTDPPYHLVSIVKRFGGENSRNTPAMNTKEGGVFARKAKGFMGKEWDGLGEDGIGIANNKEMWAEALRVLKPGGYLLAFSGTRTYHRMAVAIEDAGFEVRDMIEWVYGSGFPKSLNIGKAVDKLQGNEREVIGNGNPMSSLGTMHDDNWKSNPEYKETKGNSPWEGWGTALKPAHEPICMARKPLAEKSVAENVLKYGTGGINIDESRVESNEDMSNIKAFGSMPENKSEGKGFSRPWMNDKQSILDKQNAAIDKMKNLGRFPANLIHDGSDEVKECFPETKTGKAIRSNSGGKTFGGDNTKPIMEDLGYDDNGGNASRFFKSIIYQAKASKSERGHGNSHPTVKPVALMEYLIKMVTPPGGTVLDPFMGSGSTGVAAKQNGYDFIGIDMTPEYVEIAKARIESVKQVKTLFDI